MPARLAACGVLLAIGLALLSNPPLWAAGGTVITLPQPGMKIKSGLVMTLDFRGVDANGYRPVHLEIRTLTGAPLTADRQLRVAIAPRSYNAASTPEVSQIIELPEGSTTVESTIAIPQSSLWYSCEIKVSEDGDTLEDLSSRGIGWPGVNYWDWSEARPVILVVDSSVPERKVRDVMVSNYKTRGQDANPTQNLPEIRTLTNLFPDPNRGGAVLGDAKITDAALLSTIVDQFPRLELLPPAELPPRWIELSQYDVMVIPLADLKKLAAGEPARLKALAEWLAGGPLLIVSGVGEDFAGLAEIDKLLKLSQLPADPKAPRYAGWQPADNDDHRSGLYSDRQDMEDSMRVTNAPYNQQVIMQQNFPRRPNFRLGQQDDVLKAPAQVPFALRPAGLGVIVGIATDRPFSVKETDWMWILNSVPRNHWMWYQRHGFSLHRTNDDYWTFLIPGVGEAPVVSFLLLVSLFAVLIGPVNYMLLGRVHRLYLLLITVPIGAFLVTGSLFTYALLTDGVGVKLRTRSFTDLDQRKGQAISWSRQSYYASIAPSRGLVFPDDCTVFPILHHPGQFRSADGPTHYLAWDDQQQHLTDGYLTSRTATQFMVLRVTDSPENLLVRESRFSGQLPEVTNHLKTDIQLVVLRDKQGDFWLGEKLPDNAKGTLAATTAKDAGEKLRKLYGANPPEKPRGYDPNVHNNALSIFMPQYSWYNVDTGSSQPVMASSLLEMNLAASTNPAQSLTPGMYIAVTGAPTTVPYGVPKVREEASLHIIRGKY